MARMPEISWVGEQGASSGRMSRYDVVCIHTIVGYAPAHAAHFSTGADGEIFQSRDTVYRSAANLNGNYRVISIENEDHGPEYGSWGGSDVPGFTPKQCEAIARICAWANQVHGIPLTLAPDSRPGSRGIGYHRQGIDGNFGDFDYGGRVAGGEVWSSSRGKVCPGDRRISQVINIIIPRARQIASGQTEETDLDQREHLWLENIHEKVMHNTFGKEGRWYDGDAPNAAEGEKSGAGYVRATFDSIEGRLTKLEEANNRLTNLVKEVLAAVKGT